MKKHLHGNSPFMILITISISISKVNVMARRFLCHLTPDIDKEESHGLV